MESAAGHEGPGGPAFDDAVKLGAARWGHRRNCSKSYLSGIEKGGAISQRPKPLLERLGWPDVVAIEADMLRAQRGNVGEQVIRQSFGLGAKLGNGVAQVDGAPRNDGGDRKVEARGTVALVFEGGVPTLAVTMEKQDAGECVFDLALVEPGIGTTSERGI